MLSFKSIFSVLCSSASGISIKKCPFLLLWSHIRNGFLLCIFKLSWNVFIWLGRLAWHLVWDEYKSVIYAVFYRVLLSKDDFPRESISFIFPQLNIESRKLRVPRDISLGPRSTASWCLLAAPHTQKMRAYFSATSTQSTTQGGDLLRKRMTYDFSLLDFFFKSQGTTIR